MRDFLGSHIELENSRALLVPLSSENSEKLRDIIFDEGIWQYTRLIVRTEDDFQAYVSDLLAKKSVSAYPFLIIDKLTNEVAGSSCYGNIDPLREKLEIGWTWYGRKFQGTGLNKACKYELLRYGFEEIAVRRIQFSVDAKNLRSRRAVEKLGAVREGVFRNNHIDSRGNSRDGVYYSIIREDWPGIKRTTFAEYLDEHE